MILGVSKYFYLFSFLSAICFILFPQIDIYVSSLFYDPSVGFLWAKEPVILFLYAIPRPIVIFAVIALLLLIIDLIIKREIFGIRALVLFYLVSVMIMGPGLLVHNVFKDNWGRARPVKITEFNGTQKFTPAFILSNQCHKNCSFVSGHSAGTYGLIALALLVKRRRFLALSGAIALGSFVGLARIIQGGHFFSDVFFSFIFVYMTAKILYYLTFEKRVFNFIERRISK